MKRQSRSIIFVFSLLVTLALPQATFCFQDDAGASPDRFQQSLFLAPGVYGNTPSPQTDPSLRVPQHVATMSIRRGAEIQRPTKPFFLSPQRFQNPVLRFLTIKRHLFSAKENDSEPPLS